MLSVKLEMHCFFLVGYRAAHHRVLLLTPYEKKTLSWEGLPGHHPWEPQLLCLCVSVSPIKALRNLNRLQVSSSKSILNLDFWGFSSTLTHSSLVVTPYCIVYYTWTPNVNWANLGGNEIEVGGNFQFLNYTLAYHL